MLRPGLLDQVASRLLFSSRKSSSNCLSMIKHIDMKAIEQYAKVTGDHNPIHLERGDESIVHGGLLIGLVSALLGSSLPGSVLLSLEAKFSKPCFVGSRVIVKVELEERRKVSQCTFTCASAEQDDTVFMEGIAKVRLPKSEQ